MRSRFAFLIIQIHHSFLICFLIFSCFTLAFHLLFQNKCFILRQLSRSKDRKNYFIISEITHCRFRRNTTRVNIDVGRNSFVCAVVWFPSICLSKTILYKHPLCNIVYFLYDSFRGPSSGYCSSGERCDQRISCLV